MIDHLRLDLMLVVGTEEGVVDKIAVVAGAIGSRPDGIKDSQIGRRRKPKDLLGVFCSYRWGRQSHRGGRRGTLHYLSATNALHP